MVRVLVAAVVLFGVLTVRAEADTLRVGSLDLRSCGASAYCGKLSRPLDPAKPTGRRIDIAFRWYRAPKTPSGPPLVAVEGGPGYPSTGSRVEFRGIFGALVRRRGLLLVDNRGTGGSALIDCKGVQSFTGRTSGSAFARRAGRCGRFIERRFGRGASALFSTAYAAADLAAVLRALRIRRIDLFGDSYGTYFVQDFIARHPRVINRVVLDSSYPRRETDPWYASSGEAFRLALEKVSPGSLARLEALLQRVRVTPLSGRTRDADGSALRVRVDARALADLVQATGSDPLTLRELDASVRAALAGDDVPLLRLTGQAGTWNFSPSEADYFSRGAYLAVNCTDLPQLFDLRASPARRRAQLEAAVAPEGAFAPFTAAEWLTISGFQQPYDVCLDWPEPSKRPPRLPETTLAADVPILIVGGDLDSLTPLLDASVFGPKLGTRVEIVPLPNTTHVTSQGGDFLTYGKACARTVIRSFLRGRLDPACTAAIPALHTPDYAPAPATLVSGPDPGEAARRFAAIGVQAFADAVFRRYYSGVDRGPGLRGGTFTARGNTYTLRAVRFTPDVTVSGTGRADPSTGGARVDLTVRGVPLTAEWTQLTPQATVRIGDAVLSTPAP
jgi:pimeloyl-ACP methyl ester carboxylesterase